MKPFIFLGILALLLPSGSAADFLALKGKGGPGAGKNIVLLSGDEEYRSEEALPQLAKILAEHHGFNCTVLFPLDPATGIINPNNQTSLPGAEALDSADVIIMSLRFRHWPDEQMKHFVDAYLAGKPIIALRTSTHAFSYPADSKSPYAKFSWDSKTWQGGFGRQVLGETWVAHHGAHKKEATRGIIEPSAKDDPILKGVTDIFGNTDVYTAHPPDDVKTLVRGQVLSGMNPTNSPVTGPKNNPLQPVVWSRVRQNEVGHENKIFCTTMGAATDLENEGLRRIIVNAVYWGVGLDVPARANVALVGDYHPTMYGFDGFQKGRKIADLAGGAESSLLIRTQADVPKDLQLQSGDHIAIIGNTLADRFQHSGWLETFIQAKFPNQNLSFRNLAVAGDEVAVRHRPENFGSQDEWLTRVKADVIFAFFGFNESFKGAAGLPNFRADLVKFLHDAMSKNYSGKGNARVVLFSPIAVEKIQDPNFDDGTALNANVKAYAEAMREVAAENGVLFVDLFSPSVTIYEKARSQGISLTINGIHLTDRGDKAIAEVIFKSLFNQDVVSVASQLLKPEHRDSAAGAEVFMEKLRNAVLEKDKEWESRYRTIDGNNVYGGRSALAYQPEKGGFITDRTPSEPYVSNYKVMQEEMAQRDVLTANRDRLVWSVANGKEAVIQDTNLPAVTKIKSNHPGPNADESFPFLGGEEAIGKMKVHAGMKVNLFASEEQFPELAKPVQMAWDTKGRLWVAVWPNYPERTPDSKIGDSLIILEDTNGDGKADKCTHFIDDLNGPTGFQFYKDGVLLMEAPDLWYVRDTNHDGKADSIERVLMGLSSSDSHHTANAMCLDPGGAVYLSDGVFHRTQVETLNGPLRNNDAAIYRYEPRTGRFETYAAYGFANPHGRVFDYWGNDLITDGTGNNTYFGAAMSGHLDYPAKHDGLNEFWNRPSRPCAATTLLTSRHFPAEFQGNFLNCNVIGFQGIYRVKVSEEGSGLKGETLPDIVSSSDPNFRPVAVSIGPDGAIYFCDWQNPIIGHMQHHLRDPNRDHDHGRVYRVTYEGRPLMKPPRIDGQSIPALLELLKSPENQVRDLVKVELGKHPASEVLPALNKWMSGLNKKDADYEHNMMECLWVQQSFNGVGSTLLKRMLQSPEPRARAAAGRVLCYTRDHFPDALDQFKKLADDENPRVRLEAVRAASFWRNPEAIEIAFIALKHPTDYYLDYVLHETVRQLEPWWHKALEPNGLFATASGDNNRWTQPQYNAGWHYLFQSISTTELMRLPRTPMALQTLLGRVDAPDADRMVALGDLAKARKQDPVTVLLSEVSNAGDQGPASASRRRRRASASDSVTPAAVVARLIPFQLPENLKPARSRLKELATSNRIQEVREYSWAGLAAADGTFDNVWKEASQNSSSLADLLTGIPSLQDPAFRATAYDRVKPLIDHDTMPVGGAENISTLQQAATRALTSMNHEPATVFVSLVNLMKRQLNANRNEVPLTARGLHMIPHPQWPRTEAGEAANTLVAWAKGVPATDRTSANYSDTVQLAQDLAGLLPADQATNLRKELAALRVSSFVIRTVREQMRYDIPRLVVEAGKPFQILFENDDFMPHNLLIVKPNTREKLGPIAAALKPDELDGEGRAFVPSSPDILAATRLLVSGQRETLKLTAPTTEGDHEYFCSYPGHYQVMRGLLVVTRDVDAYLQAHPESPVPAANPASGEEGEDATHKHAH